MFRSLSISYILGHLVLSFMKNLIPTLCSVLHIHITYTYYFGHLRLLASVDIESYQIVPYLEWPIPSLSYYFSLFFFSVKF